MKRSCLTSWHSSLGKYYVARNYDRTVNDAEQIIINILCDCSVDATCD